MKTVNTLILLVVATAALAASAADKTNAPATRPAVQPAADTNAPARLPRLLDLGANKCIPCRMMAPILEELKKEHAGTLEIEFIDVWKNPDAGKTFGIEVIPTQIFFDANGKELFRHVGFFGKEDILKKWKELGVDLAKKH